MTQAGKKWTPIWEVEEGGSERRDGGKKGLTSHRVGAGHEVEGDGVGGAGRHALHAPLRDLVEAVGGGCHVLVQPVKEGIHACFLRLPQFQVPPPAVAVLPTATTASIHIL